MEVPGKREINNFSCKPCEESDMLTQADGFCTNCEEYMCSSCFNAHKKYKLNRDHILMDCNWEITRREDSGNFEKCEQHSNEPVKFYCAQHEQVGCGDCMVIGHRSCKVDYVLDKANDLTGTTELGSLTKGPEICTTEAKRLLSSIKNNKVQVDDINDKFKQEVNFFWEEITTHINKLRDRMLKEGECIKDKDSLSMTKLEGETESLINDISVISNLFESKVQNPSQLFVCYVSQKPKLDRLMKQLNDIKSRNKIETYKFIEDSNITRTLASLGQLGRLQKDKDLYDQEEIIEQGVSKPLKTFEDTARSVVSTPLLERQLICRHVKVDGEYNCSYVGNGVGDSGLYVDKNVIVDGRYFEIEILSLGRLGRIALGLVPDDYSAKKHPGWGKNSIAYHADDGRLYYESGFGKVFGPRYLVGDKIGCWINKRQMQRDKSRRNSVTVVFTRNGEKVGERKISDRGVNLYPAVGMHSSGEKIGQAVVHSYDKLYAAVGMLSPGAKVKIVQLNQI